MAVSGIIQGGFLRMPHGSASICPCPRLSLSIGAIAEHASAKSPAVVMPCPRPVSFQIENVELSYRLMGHPILACGIVTPAFASAFMQLKMDSSNRIADETMNS
jgi:hypothetical protein